MGFLSNWTPGSGISNVLSSIFGGVSSVTSSVLGGTGGLVQDVGQSGVLDSAAATAAVGALVPGADLSALGSLGGGSPKPGDDKLFDYNTTQESDTKWPWIIGGIILGLIVVGGIVWAIVSPRNTTASKKQKTNG